MAIQKPAAKSAWSSNHTGGHEKLARDRFSPVIPRKWRKRLQHKPEMGAFPTVSRMSLTEDTRLSRTGQGGDPDPTPRAQTFQITFTHQIIDPRAQRRIRRVWAWNQRDWCRPPVAMWRMKFKWHERQCVSGRPVARQDLPEAKFHGPTAGGHENEETELVTIGASMPRYKSLTYPSHTADYELEVVDEVERLLGNNLRRLGWVTFFIPWLRKVGNNALFIIPGIANLHAKLHHHSDPRLSLQDSARKFMCKPSQAGDELFTTNYTIFGELKHTGTLGPIIVSTNFRTQDLTYVALRIIKIQCSFAISLTTPLSLWKFQRGPSGWRPNCQ